MSKINTGDRVAVYGYDSTGAYAFRDVVCTVCHEIFDVRSYFLVPICDGCLARTAKMRRDAAFAIDRAWEKGNFAS